MQPAHPQAGFEGKKPPSREVRAVARALPLKWLGGVHNKGTQASLERERVRTPLYTPPVTWQAAGKPAEINQLQATNASGSAIQAID